jgi:hypothetical protein
MLDTLTKAVFVVSVLVAIVCMQSLWRGRYHTSKKIFWTLFLFVPVMGPILYAGLFEPPPVKPKNEQPEFDPASRRWK